MKELTNKELNVKALIEAVSHHNVAIKQSIITGQPSGSGVNIPQEEEVGTDEELDEDFDMEF